MWSQLLQALGLVLIIEGIMPFLSPSRWRRLLVTALRLDDRSLRLFGLGIMLLGLGLLYLVRN